MRQPCKKEKKEAMENRKCADTETLCFKLKIVSVLNAMCICVLMLPPTGGQTEHQVSYFSIVKVL